MTYTETIVLVSHPECQDLSRAALTELSEFRTQLSDIYGLAFDDVDLTETHRQVWYLKNPMTSDTIWEGLADIADDHLLFFEIIERQ